MKQLWKSVMITGVSVGMLCAATACVPLVIGGAAAGGYLVGKDERKFGTIVDDASIVTAVHAEYGKDKYIKSFGINVDCYNGVVTLKGNLPNRAVRERAVVLAQRVKGVKKVNSQLAIKKQRT